MLLQTTPTPSTLVQNYWLPTKIVKTTNFLRSIGPLPEKVTQFEIFSYVGRS